MLSKILDKSRKLKKKCFHQPILMIAYIWRFMIIVNQILMIAYMEIHDFYRPILMIAYMEIHDRRQQSHMIAFMEIHNG